METGHSPRLLETWVCYGELYNPVHQAEERNSWKKSLYFPLGSRFRGAIWEWLKVEIIRIYQKKRKKQGAPIACHFTAA
jgi:hypothetical protein